MVSTQRTEIRCAEQSLAQLDLGAKDLQNVARSLLAVGRQPPERGAPDEHRLRTERKRHT